MTSQKVEPLFFYIARLVAIGRIDQAAFIVEAIDIETVVVI
jgi:hypothetical protein